MNCNRRAVAHWQEILEAWRKAATTWFEGDADPVPAVLNANAFLRWVDDGGLWVLAEASPIMRSWVKQQYPGWFDEEVRRYETPQKYLVDGDLLIIVQLMEENWGGVVTMPRHGLFVEDGPVPIVRYAEPREFIVSVQGHRSKTARRRSLLPGVSG